MAIRQTTSGLTFKSDPKRLVPYSKFKFLVEIDGFVKAGFHKVSGLEAKTEVRKYRDGGDTNQLHKAPGTTDFTDITLERGMSEDTDFISWYKEASFIDDATVYKNPKRDLTIILCEADGSEVRRWNVYGAFPINYKFDELDAESNDNLLEYLTLSIDAFELVE